MPTKNLWHQFILFLRKLSLLYRATNYLVVPRKRIHKIFISLKMVKVRPTSCLIIWLIILLYSIIRCIALSDLTGDGDSKLVVADLGSGNYNMKLRVYKGTQLVKVLNIYFLLGMGRVNFSLFQSKSKPASLPDSTKVIYVVVIQSNSLQFPILSYWKKSGT